MLHAAAQLWVLLGCIELAAIFTASILTFPRLSISGINETPLLIKILPFSF